MRYSSLLLTSATIAILGSPAFAQVVQPAAPAQEDQSTTAIEDVIVTAQKREQRLQDVPVAVTALTAETLEARNVSEVADVARLAPSLTVTESGQATNNSINIRGIGTTAFSIGVEAAVAAVVDDVALVQQGQAFSPLADIARIEVLRGPQGTLFGKNASAGAINIVTQGPTDYLTGQLTAVATTDREYRLEGSVSGPLGDKAGFRLNAFHVDRDGYIKNAFTGNWLNGEEASGVRARLDVQPTDRIDLAFVASYSDSEVDSVNRTFRSATPNATIFGASVATNFAGITLSPSNYTVRLNTEPVNKSESQLYSAKATFDLGFASLSSITSYQDWKFSFIEDLDNLAIPTLTVPTNPASPLAPDGSYQFSDFHTTNFAQELRLASNSEGPFNYLLGAYYADSSTDRSLDRGPNTLATFVAGVGNTTYALFGQATYDFTPQTHLDLGLRWGSEDINVYFLNRLATATTCRTAACVGESSEESTTYKIALRQDLSDDVMVYASFATGYKGQGYDVSTSFTPAQAATPVRSEGSDAYEIGMKSRFAEGRIQANLTGFWTDYTDFQTQSVEEDPVGSGTFVNRLRNVGTVRSRGVELDGAARVTQQFRVDFSAAYIDARITEFPNAPCFNGQTLAEGCIDVNPSPTVLTGQQDLAGKRLTNSPKFKYSLAGTYDLPLPSLPFDAFFSGEYAYRTGVNFALGDNPRQYQGAYGVFNANLGLDDKEGRYRATLFVNNLFNEHYASNIAVGNGGSTTALGGGYTVNDVVVQVLPRASRRYFGVRLRAKF